MGRQDEIIRERLRKIEELKKQELNPFISKHSVKNISAKIKEKYSGLKAGEMTKYPASVGGRLMSIRDMGKISFGTLNDGYGTIQIILQENETPEKTREFFKRYIDSGDFIAAEGNIFRTQRGEISILAEKITLLTKSILPLPEKWHGLQNEEEKLRKRYLDILMSQETKEMFVRKSKFWNSMRAFLLEKDFLEVETPVLENSAGGASATPFVTHHNALDLDVYLRISMGELWQKKLMVAGYSKTFEIGRQFRNEGMDAEHLQDYTQMEFYWAYVNYEEGMKLVEEMYKKLAKDVYGRTKFKVGAHEFDLSEKWKVIDYADTVKKMTSIDIFNASEKEIISKLKELKVEYEEKAGKSTLIDSLWKYCRKSIAGPAFLTGTPVEVSPLAKRDSKDPRKTERFQVILAGSEVGNGYSELNDPIDQEERFKSQQMMKEAGDSEAQSHDVEFVEALKYGMPPTCGFGVSERLFAFLEGKPIRETVIFPLMRPEHVEENKSKKSKESKVAVALINKSLGLEPWQELNTVGHLTAAFGARSGRKLFFQDKISTKDEVDINLNIQHAIMIKEIGSTRDILEVIKEARSKDLEISEFTREMIETTDDQKVIDKTKKTNWKDVEYLGILIFGNKSEVDKLTSKFNLFTSYNVRK